MRHKVSRYEVLEEMQIAMEAEKRRFSRNHYMVEPKPGYEIPWEEAEQKLQIIREMMIEARYGEAAKP